MTTNPGQINPRMQKFVLQLLVIFALLATVVLVGYIWNSQRVLSRDHHLTYAGARILLWDPVLSGPEKYREGSVHWYLNREDLTMTPAAAAHLANNYENNLVMGLRQLSPSVARGLSQTRHALSFVNFEFTSPELLAAVVSGRCPILHLPAPNLTEAGAKALSQFKGDQLSVVQMTRLSPEAAKALSRCEVVSLSLLGLDHLSEEAAEELSRCRTDWLSIGSLESISETTASALSRFQGQRLTLYITNISETTASALSRFQGQRLTLSLHTTGTHISETTASALSRFQGQRLTLSMTHISETTASALSRFQGQRLTLSLTHISEEVAVALSHYDGLLWLNGLRTLPDAAAHALAGRKLLKVGENFRGPGHYLENLPASAAAILREANNNSQ